MKQVCMATTVALLMYGSVSAQTLQGAAQAKHGTGKYKNQIYWVNWDLDDNGYHDDVISNANNTTVVRTVAVPGGITYTITFVSKNNTEITSYVPGWWDWDDLKAGYNWFTNGVIPYNFRYYNEITNQQVSNMLRYDYSSDPHTKVYANSEDAHNSIIGIKNKHENNVASFNIKISGVYTGTSTPVSADMLKGFVFAGAESLRGGASANFDPLSNEYYSLVNNSNNNPWRIIDTVQNRVPSGWTHYGVYSWAGRYVSGEGFTEAANVTNGGKSITLYNKSNSIAPAAPSSPAKPNGGSNASAVTYFEGPGDVVWMADGSTDIDVTFKGNGYTAIAVGFIYSTDLGDAPISYGTNVANIQDVSFSGGILPVANDVQIKNQSLGVRASANLKIGSLIDDESVQAYSANATGDDVSNLADEDGLTANGAIANFVANSNAQSITVPVVNNGAFQATLAGWIDINRNGIFEPNEIATATIPANSGASTAVLNWTNLSTTFKYDMDYILRMRIYDVNNQNDVDSLHTPADERSFVSFIFGETEDHMVRINTPVPVKLLGFDGYSKDCKSFLNWTSAIENNLESYEVEKSVNGLQFTSIARIKGLGSNNAYNYVDDEWIKGAMTYRLKMIDIDGKYDYSAILKLNNTCAAKISVLPTVTKDILRIEGAVSGNVVNIFNMNGQLVKTINLVGAKDNIDVSKLNAGNYYLMISEFGKPIFTQTFIKQ